MGSGGVFSLGFNMVQKSETPDADPRTIAVVYGEGCEVCIRLLWKLVPRTDRVDPMVYRRAIVGVVASPDDRELGAMYVGLSLPEFLVAVDQLAEDGILDDRHGHGRLSVRWLEVSKRAHGESNGKEAQRDGGRKPINHKAPRSSKD